MGFVGWICIGRLVVCRAMSKAWATGSGIGPICWLAVLWMAGCVGAPPILQVYQNPLPIPYADRDLVWDQVVDVVDNYFDVEREDRVRLEGNVLTVGRIDTVPEPGSTFLEIFRGDSATPYEKLESTLQSIRRRALVQVVPTENGYLVDVAVYKELEDVPQPEMATAGRATLRHDTSNRRDVPHSGEQPIAQGWIPLGRDPALEQRMLHEIYLRLARPPAWPPGWRAWRR